MLYNNYNAKLCLKRFFMQYLIDKLNAKTEKERLDALAEILKLEKEKPTRRDNDANNHIHTIYSFSPYSPTKAAYMAYKAGLTSAGIMDHDSLGGAIEFKKACKMLNLGSTCGVEVRAKFDRGFGKINHPDQPDCIYMAAHGIPEKNIVAFNEYLAPFREKRNERNKKMCEAITRKFSAFNVSLSFEKDVMPLSECESGGSITERHLLYALSIKLSERFTEREELIAFLEKDLKLSVSDKIKGYLLDESNPHFLYDLLGVLKADTEFFYINADEEMPLAEDFILKAKEFGAIPAYAYLGDVGNSVTGDKKAQKFEDDFLPQLISEIKKAGFQAVAYMPTRNTKEQLDRLIKMCRENCLFEISGEDINSPRQKFECVALSNPRYSHLIESTWALIGHEAAMNKGSLVDGMFNTPINSDEDMQTRIKKYAEIGRKSIN